MHSRWGAGSCEQNKFLTPGWRAGGQYLDDRCSVTCPMKMISKKVKAGRGRESSACGGHCCGLWKIRKVTRGFCGNSGRQREARLCSQSSILGLEVGERSQSSQWAPGLLGPGEQCWKAWSQAQCEQHPTVPHGPESWGPRPSPGKGRFYQDAAGPGRDLLG